MISNVILEKPRFIYKNFAGTVNNYNPKGIRSFCVILDDKWKDVLVKDGWNVKYLKPRKEGAPEVPYLKVAINYKYFNKPEIYVLSSTGKVLLPEEKIDILDKIEIHDAKLVLRAYRYKTEITEGINAYLKTLEINNLFVPGLEASAAVKDVAETVSEPTVNEDNTTANESFGITIGEAISSGVTIS